MTLASMSEVDIAIGIAGTNSAWDTSISIMSDAMHNGAYNNIIDTGVNHNSLASSLVTMVVKASPILAASNAPGTYTMSLDYLTSMHFLSDTKFDEVQTLMRSNQAYTSDMNTATGFMEVQFTAAASQSCSTSTNNLYSCAIRRSVVGGVSVTPDGVHDFSFGDHSDDDTGCANFITRNLLGTNEFSTALALNMTRMVRSKFEINNYMRRAWYINPGYEWPSPAGTTAQSSLSLTDKMIAVAVISLRDVATGRVTGRRCVLLYLLHWMFCFVCPV
jgi:hypothetical protein